MFDEKHVRELERVHRNGRDKCPAGELLCAANYAAGKGTDFPLAKMFNAKGSLKRQYRRGDRLFFTVWADALDKEMDSIREFAADASWDHSIFGPGMTDRDKRNALEEYGFAADLDMELLWDSLESGSPRFDILPGCWAKTTKDTDAKRELESALETLRNVATDAALFAVEDFNMPHGFDHIETASDDFIEGIIYDALDNVLYDTDIRVFRYGGETTKNSVTANDVANCIDIRRAVPGVDTYFVATFDDARLPACVPAKIRNILKRELLHSTGHEGMSDHAAECCVKYWQKNRDSRGCPDVQKFWNEELKGNAPAIADAVALIEEYMRAAGAVEHGETA